MIFLHIPPDFTQISGKLRNSAGCLPHTLLEQTLRLSKGRIATHVLCATQKGNPVGFPQYPLFARDSDPASLLPPSSPVHSTSRTACPPPAGHSSARRDHAHSGLRRLPPTPLVSIWNELLRSYSLSEVEIFPLYLRGVFLRLRA